MASVPRRLIAVVVSLAVQMAAVTGPIVHAHPDEHETDHHRAKAVHAHWAGHARISIPHDASAIDSDDHDRAVFLDTYVAVTASSFAESAITPTTVELPVPAERPGHPSVTIVRAHDPPCLTSLPSRAPPVLSVLI